MRALIWSGAAVAVDDRGVVLGRDDAARLAEILERDGVELAADLLADDGATGQDGDVAEHLLAAIAEARRLDAEHGDGAAELVHDERGEGLTVDVLGDDQHGLALLDGLLERRQQVLDAEQIFLSVIRMSGFSRTASMRSGLVTKYAEM